jgi:hypothetical protein
MFNNIEGLRSHDDVVEYEPWQMKELIKCSEDPIYFIKNYVKINMKDKGLQLFDLYDFQEDLINTITGNRNTLVKFPRQCGKCFDKMAKLSIMDESGIEHELTVNELYEILDNG